MSETQPEHGGRGLARAALIASLIGFIAAWTFPFFDDELVIIGALLCAPLGFLLGVLALILGKVRPKAFGGSGLAQVALILGVGGVVSFLHNIPIGHSRLSANESANIGDIRTVLSAEIAFSTANGEYFDTPECLQTPSRCIPGYQGPQFLDATTVWVGTAKGYVRTFHPGPPAPADVVAQGKVSPRSVTSFAYVTIPKEPNSTGVRCFCGDSTGLMTYTTDGSAPPVKDGACLLEGAEQLR
jgi:hypothetical protein